MQQRLQDYEKHEYTVKGKNSKKNEAEENKRIKSFDDAFNSPKDKEFAEK